jgi:branched-chain amino acid transport system ATP-binding protein
MSAAGPPQSANSAPSGGSEAREPEGPPQGRTGECEARTSSHRPRAWGDHTSAAGPLLRVTSLVKAFGGVVAVRDVSFAVARGEVVAMIGPNGAGKTTCFNVIHGELPADAGDVWFDGRSIAGRATHAIARGGVGRTFQVAATFASMTVRESLALALAADAGRDDMVLAGMLDATQPPIDALLARLALADLADAHCAALAYGDAKRVELALALAGEPRLLLMDEPTAGMTPRARHELMSLVTGLAARDNVAVLFTEHDMDIVFGFADRVLVLDRGALIAAGSPAAIRSDPRVRAVYLGDDEPA